MDRQNQHNEIRRPCVVRHTNVEGEVPAHFHHWITDGTVWISTNKVITSRNRLEAAQRIFDSRMIEPGFELHAIPVTLGLVEYEDGSVDNIDPKMIRFLDTEEVMFAHIKPTETTKPADWLDLFCKVYFLNVQTNSRTPSGRFFKLSVPRSIIENAGKSDIWKAFVIGEVTNAFHLDLHLLNQEMKDRMKTREDKKDD